MAIARAGAGRHGRRRSLAWRAGVVVCGLGLAACGQSGSSNSSADQAFVQQVHAQAPDISNYRTDSELVKLGEAVCNQFSAKATVEQVADRIASQGSAASLPSEDLGAVMNAAVQTLCPKYASALSGTSPG